MKWLMWICPCCLSHNRAEVGTIRDADLARGYGCPCGEPLPADHLLAEALPAESTPEATKVRAYVPPRIPTCEKVPLGDTARDVSYRLLESVFGGSGDA